MRASAPSALRTVTTALNAVPSGMSIMNRKRMNVTRSATDRVPAATRYPPTPSTARKAPWIARPLTGHRIAPIRAIRTPSP